MSPRTAYRISLAFGLIVLGLTVYSITQPAPPVCGNLQPRYVPIIAFELVRSVAGLHAIFGNAPSACRTLIAQQMDRINTVDSLLFIQVYGAFLVFFFLAQRPISRPLANTAIVLVIIACIADHIENFALFHLSADPDHASWIALLVPATETKWIGLGIAAFLAVPLLKDALRYIAVIMCGAGLVATIASLPAPAVVGPYLSNAVALGWLLFFAIDIRQSIRGGAPT